MPAGERPVVLGFDFPIGVPRAYARRAGITHFPSFLREAGHGAWEAFFEVADLPEEISLTRPFFPRSGLPKGSKSRGQLEQRLGLSWADLLRRCERVQPDRREACSLFWTLGGNQVGKGALTGWRLLQAAPAGSLNFWPFDGPLVELVQPGRVVVTETYPVANAWAESDAMHHRMLITPQDYMRAEREFSGHGLGVVGNYHSHPDHEAVPSQFDLEHLAPWPTMSYIVVSVREGGAIDLRSWELEADRSRFNEEEFLKGS